LFHFSFKPIESSSEVLSNNAGHQKMTTLFETNRNYVLGDQELEIIGDREKLAQWRHKGLGPAYYKLGRKVIYCGSDLNAWAEANKIDPEAATAI
jgi:hypothetical protein